MGTETKDEDDAVAHVLDVMRSFDACILTTTTSDGMLHSRPMAIAVVEDDGRVCMLTDDDSPKVFEIAGDARVSLTMQSRTAYAAARGRAVLNHSRERIREVWRKEFEPWFANGVDDPKIVMIEVEPELVEIWDHRGVKGIRAAFERARGAVSRDVAKIPEGAHDVVELKSPR
jgi:general stress protein 26